MSELRELATLEHMDLSIALSGELDERLSTHFAKDGVQEDLTFAYWRPSRGAGRYTAIINQLALPLEGDRILQGNVAFTAQYLSRVLDECPEGSGIALLHSHLGPGWQGMSTDDIVAERDRLAGVVAGRTCLPLVGLTWATDRTWSGRFWFRVARHQYERRWASTVRSVGSQLRMSYHPDLRPPSPPQEAQVASRSVWGDQAQENLARIRVGIVGLGSVGLIVAEALSRTGIEHITLIDHDELEERNLDRTLGANRADAARRTPKVRVSERLVNQSHTAAHFKSVAIPHSVLTPEGLNAALDCDVIICCVDRPWPRDVLNRMAYLHLIPIIDGGIFARVSEQGRLLHVDWRIHTVGPGRACLYCLDALLRSDAALDRDGKLDDPDYIKGLTPEELERYGRRNIFAFSLSVAAHEVLQLVGLVTGQQRIGGLGPQHYHAYPGTMEVRRASECKDDCDISPLTGSANDLLPTAPAELVPSGAKVKPSLFEGLRFWRRYARRR